MRNKPLDFQRATADHVLEAFGSGRRRVLVADEAGLGKTTVAAEVVRRVKAELSRNVLDDNGLYCIVYVCCNLQIAQQNTAMLSDDGTKVDLSQSRLSMQHFVYYQKRASLAAQGKDTLVLSLTPATSFSMTWGTGNACERALMYACLSLLPEFRDAGQNKKLSAMLVGYAPKAWHGLTAAYVQKVWADDMHEYRTAITEAMDARLRHRPADGDDACIDNIVRLCNAPRCDRWQQEANRLITKLRRVFADISLDVMKPDIVVMDEFQKFGTLIDNGNEARTEDNMIARKFFGNKDTYILLLSATPYKPYTTLEELNDQNSDEQYRDFHRLMDFLHADDAAAARFKTAWREYSYALKHLDKEPHEAVVCKHRAAENSLYNVMARTERANDGIIAERKPGLGGYLSTGDITAYIQMQHLARCCKKYEANVYAAPVDYTKSAAYQLSFMDGYTLKDYISKACMHADVKALPTDCLLLDGDKVNSYGMSNYKHAKLEFLIDNIFGHGKEATGAETLLWVPASHPYYTQPGNVFTRNTAFSKYLVFSSWGMVPKMLACLLSYETERRLLHKKKNDTYQGSTDTPLLKDSDGKKRTKALSVLCTASRWLASLYDPEATYGRPLREIRQQIEKEIKARLDKMQGSHRVKRVERVSSLDIYSLITALDNPDNPDTQITKMPLKAVSILADISIGAPAMCLYRMFERMGDDEAQTRAEEVARKMLSLFNSRTGIAAVRRNCHRYNSHFLKVVDYCIQGNLQAVLDEFAHMIGEDKSPADVADRICEAFVSAGSQPVNTMQTFGTEAKFNMRKHFALDFGNGRQTEKDVGHAINVRAAFNSPFRPFVLASTSVGQEGLDFHWYCRKVVHWNLPSNPQDLEQREGRVNRYKCLAVRRNVAKLYKETFSWNSMFAKAAAQMRGDNPQMVPYWYVPLHDHRFDGIEAEQIERIVPMYAMSEDESRYRHLIKVLSLYRLTMGQPRQEELLDMLAGKVTEEQAKELLFDLSPYSRRRKTKQRQG